MVVLKTSPSGYMIPGEIVILNKCLVLLETTDSWKIRATPAGCGFVSAL